MHEHVNQQFDYVVLYQQLLEALLSFKIFFLGPFLRFLDPQLSILYIIFNRFLGSFKKHFFKLKCIILVFG